ncbi:hypothetical protein EYC84_009118 [Monilinia fructicola]|uniref:Large ribosomal subunit protein mL49 n=1 Tax=Monilinia fructicola TaxID=38448 RepID=A0A5M9JD82_MONFR|nr:hypothetical protein EYC84_009118 [Monilinia fructicola]
MSEFDDYRWLCPDQQLYDIFWASPDCLQTQPHHPQRTKQSQSRRLLSHPKPLRQSQINRRTGFPERHPITCQYTYLPKAGGNLKQTKIRKIEGDIMKLKEHLEDAFFNKEIRVNQLTKQIIIKGWCKPQVEEFLVERNF